MHISEGVLAAPVLLAGAALAVAGTARGLRRLDPPRLPRAALLSAAFFVASLIHVPLGPASVHLLLNGLVGLLLGWAAFPSLLLALFLQALLFQFGGLVVLGANTAIMASPAVFCGLALGRLARGVRPFPALAAGFAAGVLGVLGAALLAAAALYLSGAEFLTAAAALVLAHLPVAGVEGVITAGAVGFLRRVKPDALDG